MSFLRRSSAELNRAIALQEKYPPHYRARGTISSGKLPEFERERKSSDGSFWQEFKDDVFEVYGDESEVKKVKEHYARRLTRGGGTTLVAARKRVDKKFQKFEDEGWF